MFLNNPVFPTVLVGLAARGETNDEATAVAAEFWNRLSAADAAVLAAALRAGKDERRDCPAPALDLAEVEELDPVVAGHA